MALSGKSMAMLAGGVVVAIGAAGGGAWYLFQQRGAASAPAVQGAGAVPGGDSAQGIALAGARPDSGLISLVGGDTALSAPVAQAGMTSQVRPVGVMSPVDSARAALEKHLRDSIANALRAQMGGAATAPAPASTVRPAGATLAASSSTPAPVRRAPAASRSARRTASAEATDAGQEGAASVAPARRAPMIEAGTPLVFLAETKVCAKTAQVGDPVQASVASNTTGADGALIAAGSLATFTIATVGEAGEPFTLRLRSIEVDGRSVRVSGDVTSMAMVGTKGDPNAGKKMIAGAAVGALAGRLLGKDTKSTVAGAVVGGAGGAVAARGGDSRCVPSGGRIAVTLSDAISLR